MSIHGNSQGYLRVCKAPTYYPEYTKNGQKRSAKLVVPAMSNNIGRMGEDGKRQEKESTYLELTFWGKQADTYAKYLHVGKQFYCEFRMNSYFARVYDKTRLDGSGRPSPVMGTDGKQLTKRAYSFDVIPGTVDLGNDGPKTINEERTSGIRPPGWDGKVTLEDLQTAVASGLDLATFLSQAQQGNSVWKNHFAAWKTQTYNGGDKFGYANVRIPGGEGVVCAYSTNGPAQAPAAPGKPTVDGFTYEQMIAAGWTNEQLLTAENGKYASLVPQAMAPQAPAAPAAPAVPPAPAQSFENAGV